MRKWNVFYRKTPTFQVDKNLSVDTLTKTHVILRVVYANTRDDVYRYMQGEVWSPNGEARDLIKSLGLSHTSMSVGDVISTRVGNRIIYLQCASFGWSVVPQVNYKSQIPYLGLILSGFIRITKAEQEEYVDLKRFHAPSECGRGIHIHADALRIQWSLVAEKMTSVPFHEIIQQAGKRAKLRHEVWQTMGINC